MPRPSRFSAYAIDRPSEERAMTNAEWLNLVVACGATVATGLATLAAFKSASSASAAQEALLEDQLRSGRREVAALVSSCAFEFSRVQFLARTIGVLDRSIAVFTGNHGGSRQSATRNAVAERVAAAEGHFHTAAELKGNPVSIGNLEREEIDRLQLDLTIQLGDLRAIAEELARDSSAREAQVLQHREQAIAENRS